MTIREMIDLVDSLDAVLQVLPDLVDEKHYKAMERIRTIFASLVRFNCAR